MYKKIKLDVLGFNSRGSKVILEVVEVILTCLSDLKEN
jgi:RecB family endonuclease NucS